MRHFLDKSWEKLDRICIFGFGKTALGNIDRFIDEFKVSVIIYNTVGKENGEMYRGVPIQTQEHAVLRDKIVILAAGKALQAIKVELNSIGKREYGDYCDMNTFISEYYLRFHGRLCLGKVSTSVTTRCTFRCKNCNMLMPYYKDPNDFSLEVLQQDADLLFSLVDDVTSFVVIGGEPFLYQNFWGVS